MQNSIRHNFYLEVKEYDNKTGKVVIQIWNKNAYTESRSTNYYGWLSGSPFMYKELNIWAPSWDADDDGKKENKNTNSVLKITPKVDVSKILPSNINENNYLNYLNFEQNDFPKNSVLKNIIFSPRDKEKKLEIYPIFNSHFENGKIVNQNDNIDKFKIVIDGFALDADGDNKPDQGNSTWNPKIIDSEITKKVLPTWLSVDPKDQYYIETFIVLNADNVAKNTEYTYEISFPLNDKGTILVAVYANQYFENSTLIKEKKLITPSNWILTFGKDENGDGKIDELVVNTTMFVQTTENTKKILPTKVMDGSVDEETFKNSLIILFFNEVKNKPVQYTYQFLEGDDEKGTLRIRVIASSAFENDIEKNNVVIFNEIVSGFGRDVDKNGIADFGTTLYKVSIKSEAKDILPSDLNTLDNSPNFILNFLNIEGINTFKNASFSFKLGEFNNQIGSLFFEIIVNKSFLNGTVVENTTIFSQNIIGFGKDLDQNNIVDKGTTNISGFDLNISEMERITPNIITTIPGNNYIGNFIKPKIENNFNGSELSYQIIKTEEEKGIIYVRIIATKAFLEGEVENNYQIIGPEQDGLFKIEGFQPLLINNNIPIIILSSASGGIGLILLILIPLIIVRSNKIKKYNLEHELLGNSSSDDSLFIENKNNGVNYLGQEKINNNYSAQNMEENIFDEETISNEENMKDNYSISESEEDISDEEHME
ncbi:MAG: hypothetical protein ACRCRZ_02800 [Metamycoplasmataceae bacterium]